MHIQYKIIISARLWYNEKVNWAVKLCYCASNMRKKDFDRAKNTPNYNTISVRINVIANACCYEKKIQFNQNTFVNKQNYAKKFDDEEERKNYHIHASKNVRWINSVWVCGIIVEKNFILLLHYPDWIFFLVFNESNETFSFTKSWNEVNTHWT